MLQNNTSQNTLFADWLDSLSDSETFEFYLLAYPSKINIFPIPPLQKKKKKTSPDDSLSVVVSSPENILHLILFKK